MCCTELFSNNEQCPFASVANQSVTCYLSAFPEEFYNESTDTICQYALVFLYVVTGVN